MPFRIMHELNNPTASTKLINPQFANKNPTIARMALIIMTITSSAATATSTPTALAIKKTSSPTRILNIFYACNASTLWSHCFTEVYVLLTICKGDGLHPLLCKKQVTSGRDVHLTRSILISWHLVGAKYFLIPLTANLYSDCLEDTGMKMETLIKVHIYNQDLKSSSMDEEEYWCQYLKDKKYCKVAVNAFAKRFLRHCFQKQELEALQWYYSSIFAARVRYFLGPSNCLFCHLLPCLL